MKCSRALCVLFVLSVVVTVGPSLAVARRLPPTPTVAPLSSVKGVLVVRSYHSVDETLDRFEALIRESGLTVFTRINHAANAQSVDDPIPPASLLVFGDIRAITDLIQTRPSAALDLPMRALAWQDDTGEVWLGYMDPVFLADRHNFPSDESNIQHMSTLLRTLAQRAAGFGAVPSMPPAPK